jgi:hypothetical protein
MPDERTPHLTGGCQCGSIRFAFYAEPIRIGICHCRMCQRATSSPFAALADVPMESFAWTKGQPKAFRSSSVAERHFCGDCGSPLSYHQLDGRNMEILLGAFDDPNAVPPTYAVGIESKVAWFDHLPTLLGKALADYSGADTARKITSFQSNND